MVGALVLLFAAFIGDWLTGTEALSSLFYVMAVMFGAWFVSRKAGVIVAVLSVISWIISYYLFGVPYSRPRILYWNIFAESSIYIIIALTVSQAKEGLVRARVLAGRLAQANHDLDRETMAVGNLQREMLPHAQPEIPGHRRETLYLTSTRAGGDYYDFILLPGGKIGIVMADASGHGAPAAVLVAMLRVLLHTYCGDTDQPDQVLSKLNLHLVGAMPEGHFVTVCYVVLDPPSGRLDYSLAGHDSPLLIRPADEAAQRLASCGGLPLGLFATASYESGHATLESGDTLVLHTDGVTDARSPTAEFFGSGRLIQALVETKGLDAAEISRHLLARIEEHRAGARLSDDLTLLILRRL